MPTESHQDSLARKIFSLSIGSPLPMPVMGTAIAGMFAAFETARIVGKYRANEEKKKVQVNAAWDALIHAPRHQALLAHAGLEEEVSKGPWRQDLSLTEVHEIDNFFVGLRRMTALCDSEILRDVSLSSAHLIKDYLVFDREGRGLFSSVLSPRIGMAEAETQVLAELSNFFVVGLSALNTSKRSALEILKERLDYVRRLQNSPLLFSRTKTDTLIGAKRNRLLPLLRRLEGKLIEAHSITEGKIKRQGLQNHVEEIKSRIDRLKKESKKIFWGFRDTQLRVSDFDEKQFKEEASEKSFKKTKIGYLLLHAEAALKDESEYLGQTKGLPRSIEKAEVLETFLKAKYAIEFFGALSTVLKDFSLLLGQQGDFFAHNSSTGKQLIDCIDSHFDTYCQYAKDLAQSIHSIKSLQKPRHQGTDDFDKNVSEFMLDAANEVERLCTELKSGFAAIATRRESFETLSVEERDKAITNMNQFVSSLSAQTGLEQSIKQILAKKSRQKDKLLNTTASTELCFEGMGIHPSKNWIDRLFGQDNSELIFELKPLLDEYESIRVSHAIRVGAPEIPSAQDIDAIKSQYSRLEEIVLEVKHSLLQHRPQWSFFPLRLGWPFFQNRDDILKNANHMLSLLELQIAKDKKSQLTQCAKNLKTYEKQNNSHQLNELLRAHQRQRTRNMLRNLSGIFGGGVAGGLLGVGGSIALKGAAALASTSIAGPISFGIAGATWMAGYSSLSRVDSVETKSSDEEVQVQPIPKPKAKRKKGCHIKKR